LILDIIFKLKILFARDGFQDEIPRSSTRETGPDQRGQRHFPPVRLSEGQRLK